MQPVTAAVLQVENNNWPDAVVYVARAGVRQRVGQVGSFQSATMELPSAALAPGDFYLLVDLIGATRQWVSPPVFLLDHSVIDLRIGPSLNLSTVSVRPAEPSARVP